MKSAVAFYKDLHPASGAIRARAGGAANVGRTLCGERKASRSSQSSPRSKPERAPMRSIVVHSLPQRWRQRARRNVR